MPIKSCKVGRAKKCLKARTLGSHNSGSRGHKSRKFGLNVFSHYAGCVKNSGKVQDIDFNNFQKLGRFIENDLIIL